MEAAILIAVVEYFFDLVADDEAVARIDCGVASIENAMNILSQQGAVRFCVRAAVRVWPNVSGIECGEHFAFRDCALSTIRFNDSNSKSALTQARLYQSRRAISNRRLGEPRGSASRPSLCSSLQPVP